MFEYLMPMLWMKTYPNTILNQTAHAAVAVQQKFARKNSIPWGISESACAALNPDGHYRYRAFGVPALALSSAAKHDLVVSPYSVFLSLMVRAHGSVRNLRKMKKLGWFGSYGFYEAVDFNRSRTPEGKKREIVRSWMAHHLGMSLLAATNALCDQSMQRRFHAEPQIAATERLLHEKAPAIFTFPEKAPASKDTNHSLITEQHSVLRPEYWGASSNIHLPA